MTNWIARGLIFAVLTSSAGIVATNAQTSAADAHTAAAKAAAGTEFAAVFERVCREAVAPPQTAASRAAGGATPPRPAGPPPRESWHAEPAKVFDNLYFLGQTEYSVWAITTSAGVILIDSIFDYSVDDEVVGGMKKLGLESGDDQVRRSSATATRIIPAARSTCRTPSTRASSSAPPTGICSTARPAPGRAATWSAPMGRS